MPVLIKDFDFNANESKHDRIKNVIPGFELKR